ncbi:39S ribosomal protein L16, mitochondrial [Cryptotrichosporon argae]
MLGLRPLASFSSLLRPVASSSRQIPATWGAAVPLAPTPAGQLQVRFRSQLAPRRTKYRKSQKGRPGLPTGGSLKGSTLQHAGFGLRVLESVRITAAQLTSSLAAVKRKIKPVKGAECHLRVFPDVPVCVKGNETRMGKGKGGFEYWACRVPAGRVVFEIAGSGIREEIARQALKLAQVKLSVPSEFITTSSPPRLGHIASHALVPPPAARSVPAQLADLDAKGEGHAVDAVLRREERRVDHVAAVLDKLSVGAAEARA